MDIIKIANLSIVFGENKNLALKMLDEGFSKNEIKEKTNSVVGVKNVNLNIKKGEIYVLMGLSGSGKSTLLRSINGLHSISRGNVSVLDQNIEKMNKKELRELRKAHVSMVFQNFALFPWKNVLENVCFGLEICKVKKDERILRAKEAINVVGLSNWINQYPKELSGGMQQRVGLARALALNTDILLMDEPFSALDPKTKGNLQLELLSLQERLKKTIVFVTHDFREALKVSGRMAILQDGEIVKEGSPKELDGYF